MSRRRVSAGMIVAGFLILLITLALGAVLWIKIAESARWADLEGLVSDLRAEAGTREASRPVLRGEALPGDAWEDYGPALKEIQEACKDSPGYIVEERPEVLARIQVAVDRLRRGTRHGSARNPWIVEWLSGSESNAIGEALGASQRLAGEALGLANAHWKAGRVREGAECMLDVGLFGRDVGHNGESDSKACSNQILSDVSQALRALLADARPDPETFRLIDRELAILDSTFRRSGYVICNVATREVASLLRAREFSLFGRPLGNPGWRYGFSTRLMVASGFRDLVAWTRQYLENDDVPWEDGGDRRNDWLTQECSKDRPGVVAAFACEEEVWNAERRDLHARLHLLRLAAHFRGTREFLSVPDPYGHALRHAEKDGHIKLWSVGPDGVDDGGSGSWEVPSEKDIVLEIPR